MEYHFYFIDSTDSKHQLDFKTFTHPNLMEFIRDQGYEDWGDCRGRAWCATCHISVPNGTTLISADAEEQTRLSILSNKSEHSRLACQIPLDKNICGLEFEYLGDD